MRFKTAVFVFLGLLAVNYVADLGVTDMIKTFSEDGDMSDYGIFVNADGDDIEEAEEQLRDSIDFDIDFDYEAAEAERRMLQEEPTRSVNALDATGNSRCIKDKDRVESTKGDTESKFD
jgi:hypothetical protein